MVNTVLIDILAKLHFHHYPGVQGRFQSRSGLRTNSEIILKRI